MVGIRRAVLLALLSFGALAARPPLAAAQIREGFYTVEGQNPDGSTYSGEFALQPGPGASWIASWSVSGARVSGLAVVQSGVLAVSFVVDGRPGVAAYGVEPDGRLRGSWSTGGGLGTEMLVPR